MVKKSTTKKTLKPIPKFANERAEAKFWLNHDSADYVDWSKAQLVSFPNLKPSTQTISLRLPKMMLNDLKAMANKRDVPYQSLMKMLLAQAIKNEQAGK